MSDSVQGFDRGFDDGGWILQIARGYGAVLD